MIVFLWGIGLGLFAGWIIFTDKPLRGIPEFKHPEPIEPILIPSRSELRVMAYTDDLMTQDLSVRS